MLIEYGKLEAKNERFAPIRYAAIETIAMNSDNPAFRQARFRQALIAYRRFGIRPKKKAKWSLKDALYYARHSYFIHEGIKKSAV